MAIEKANSGDADVLTDITKESKAYWGYSNEQIKIWSELLTITKAYIEANHVYKLVIDSKVIGYYSFFYEDERAIRLDNLFILPEYIGTGLGKMLMEDFLIRIKSTIVTKILLHADPNAGDFYAKFGFTKIGQIETSIKDRYLPVMELKLFH